MEYAKNEVTKYEKQNPIWYQMHKKILLNIKKSVAAANWLPLLHEEEPP